MDTLVALLLGLLVTAAGVVLLAVMFMLDQHGRLKYGGGHGP